MTTDDMLDYTKAIERKVKLATLKEVREKLRELHLVFEKNGKCINTENYWAFRRYLEAKIKEAEK